MLGIAGRLASLLIVRSGSLHIRLHSIWVGTDVPLDFSFAPLFTDVSPEFLLYSSGVPAAVDLITAEGHLAPDPN